MMDQIKRILHAKRTGGVAFTLPLAAIVAIAIAGALVLFGILTTVAIICARKRNRRKAQQRSAKAMLEGPQYGNADIDVKAPARPRAPEATFSRAQGELSNPFIPGDDTMYSNDWTGDEGWGGPPRRRSKRLSATRGAFRISAVRDSWPLVSNIPLALMPDRTKSNIQVNNVAAPGYEISSEPKWPRRTGSRNSRSSISIPRDLSRKRTPLGDPYSPSKTPTKSLGRRGPHARSASENQLSTILRSTSQRLKQVNRTPLKRTLTNLSRTPGEPPLQPLPNTPTIKPSESREPLVDSDHEESVASSVYELLRSPSPPKMESPGKSKQNRLSTVRSPSPSALSDDSLCVSPTPDLLVPAPLTSPSKIGGRDEHRRKLRVSSSAGRDLTDLLNKNNMPSKLQKDELTNVMRSQSLAHHRRFSSSSDFFSEIQNLKRASPANAQQGQRPLYVRKTTFGMDGAPQRPQSNILPLQGISGNAQGSSARSSPNPTPSNGNPFQWSPQVAMQSHQLQTSPTRRKGHSRSKFVRVSHVPRPLSATVVEEEPDEIIWPQRLQSLPHSMRNTPNGSKASSPLAQTFFSRPPSAVTFNPSLIELARSGDNSPTIGIQETITINPSVYASPTLAGNYYTDSPMNSEEDFFAHVAGGALKPTPSGSRRNSRVDSIEQLFPSASRKDRIVSFESEDLALNPQLFKLASGNIGSAPSSPKPAPRPLPQVSTIYHDSESISPKTVRNTGSDVHTILAPNLRMPIPGHLTGPRSEPMKCWSKESMNKTAINPLICEMTPATDAQSKLRRMDSGVAALSTIVSPAPETSELTLSKETTDSSSDQDSNGHQVDEQRGRSRTVLHDLSPNGMLNTPEPSKTDSTFLIPIVPSSQIRSQAPRSRRGSMSHHQTGSIENIVSASKRSNDHHKNRKRRSRESENGNHPNPDKFLRARGLVGGVGSPDSMRDMKKGRGKAKVVTLTPVKEMWSPEAVNKAVATARLSAQNAASPPLPGMGLLDFGFGPEIMQNADDVVIKSPTLTITDSSATSHAFPLPAAHNRLPTPRSSSMPLLDDYTLDSRDTRRDSREQTSKMTSMMAVGELDDFFALDVQKVDHSTFAVGSGSESDDEDEEQNVSGIGMENTSRASSQVFSSLPSPLSPILHQKRSARYSLFPSPDDSGVATARSSVLSREENELLDLYNRSPCTTPSPGLQAFVAPFGSLGMNPHAPTPARWSDATPKPPPSSTATRRESQIKHPLPKSKSSPAWVWSSAGLGLTVEEEKQTKRDSMTFRKGEERNLLKLASWGKDKVPVEKEADDEAVKSTKNETKKRSRRLSKRNSLYDKAGFYKSPDRDQDEQGSEVRK